MLPNMKSSLPLPVLGFSPYPAFDGGSGLKLGAPHGSWIVY